MLEFACFPWGHLLSNFQHSSHNLSAISQCRPLPSSCASDNSYSERCGEAGVQGPFHRCELSTWSSWRGGFHDWTMSCPHAVDATQRCVPLTSLHGLAPAFSRLGRWWRNSRLGVRPSGVGVAAMEHVVSHPPKSQSPRKDSNAKGVYAYLGEARRDGDCSIEDEAW